MDLDETITAYLLDDVPPVISQGKLRSLGAYKYVWDGEEEESEVPPPPAPIEGFKRKKKVRSSVGGNTLHKQAHNIYTHFPKCDDCEICNQCKIQRAHCRHHEHGPPDALPEPKEFAYALTADHKILNEDDQLRSQDGIALIIQDRATHWLQSYPSKTKSDDDTYRGFQRFLGPGGKAKHVYTDASKEFKKALEEFETSHDSSTPHRPQTNGVAEGAVRRVKEGTACTLLQSGWPEEMWGEAMSVYCFLRCVVVVLEHGSTAYKARFKEDFRGPIIPFGVEIKYLPISQRLQVIAPFWI